MPGREGNSSCIQFGQFGQRLSKLWRTPRPHRAEGSGDNSAAERKKHTGVPDAKIEGDATAGALAAHTAEIWKLRRAGNSKSEIARQLQICRTSVRRILGARS